MKIHMKIMLVAALVLSIIFPNFVAATENLKQNSSIYVTEAVPNSNDKNKGFEFIELYNNSDKNIKLENIRLFIRDADKDKEWKFTEYKSIEPQKTMIVWIKNKNNEKLTTKDFNNHYKTNLQNKEITTVKSNGLANDLQQTIIVTDKYKNEHAKATYHFNDIQENQSIHFQFVANQVDMNVFFSDRKATPGVFWKKQVPTTPITTDLISPTINHAPIKLIHTNENAVIRAEVTDDTVVKNVILQYRFDKTSSWKQMNMSLMGNGAYQKTIFKQNYKGSNLYYQIIAYDGVNTKESSVHQVKIYDAQKVPELLITELVPDTTNINGADGYEFIEIYNNTSKAVNFKDYNFQYRSTSKATENDKTWKPVSEDLMIPSGETHVFWLMNEKNSHSSIEDFNRHYGINLIEHQQISKIESAGMSNDEVRGIVISTNTGRDISTAYYNNDRPRKDTSPDRAIVYAFPKNPGSLRMVKLNAGIEKPTPGTITTEQVPIEKVQIPDDKEKPVVEDFTVNSLAEYQNLTFSFNITDNQRIKTVELFYKSDKMSDYNQVNLKEVLDDTIFEYTIYPPELIANKNITYYVRASDGLNETKTATKTIQIDQDAKPSGVSLNVGDDTLLYGKSIISAYHSGNPANTKLFIDGQDFTAQTSDTLGYPAYFVFDVKDVDFEYKNALTIHDDVLQMYDQKISNYTTMTVPIHYKYFKKDQKTIISIRSGTKITPFDPKSKDNRDDFNIKNIRLILKDGTVLYDGKYRNPSTEIKVGDGSNATPTIHFSFDIPEHHYKAKMLTWDTTTINDGKHRIEAKNNQDSSVSTVIVDNSPPSIRTTVEKGKTYKGNFTLDAEAKDQLSGLDTIRATLDGEEITLPFKTSSAQLAPGAHEFVIEATDRAKNTAKEKVTFHVVEEMPFAPVLISPTNGKKKTSLAPILKVKVTDPTDDELSVSFMKGFNYKGDQKNHHIKVYQNSVDREPPRQMIPKGEKQFVKTENLGKANKKYLTTKSVDKFPYHRFEVTLDKEVKASDEIEIIWQGKSLTGRKVSMYIWNHQANEWELQTWKIASNNKNFTLKANITGSQYIKSKKVQVMVQDEIAATDQFNYSFVWMSDTQYYASKYPHIYQRMTEWIVNQRDNLNIKYVFHTGDIVDKENDIAQWQIADKAMKVLDDAGMPYGVLAGNHDVGHHTGDYTQYSKYFGEARFLNKDYYGGSYKNNRGHYDLISVDGNDFIMLYMGWGINDEDIAWLNQVLATYPEKKAILNFHEYLLSSGNRGLIGEKLFKEVVKKNKNVIAILSGHYYESQVLVDEIDDNNDGKPDRKVYQILANYQGAAEGGLGFMRLLKVNPIENKIYVKTYSPYIDQDNYYDEINYPGKDDFVMDIDLTPAEKVVATDSFEVNVYTNTKLKEVKGIESGKRAEFAWKGLKKNTKYSWYVHVQDEFNGKTRSKIWTFTTNNK